MKYFLIGKKFCSEKFNIFQVSEIFFEKAKFFVNKICNFGEKQLFWKKMCVEVYLFFLINVICIGVLLKIVGLIFASR